MGRSFEFRSAHSTPSSLLPERSFVPQPYVHVIQRRSPSSYFTVRYPVTIAEYIAARLISHSFPPVPLVLRSLNVHVNLVDRTRAQVVIVWVGFLYSRRFDARSSAAERTHLTPHRGQGRPDRIVAQSPVVSHPASRIHRYSSCSHDVFQEPSIRVFFFGKYCQCVTRSAVQFL